MIHTSHGAPPWKVPMRARSPHDAHRVATPLELFFDLVFVVAIAQAAAGLHHAVAEVHIAHAIISYLMVFFGLWWAWMNFTWFASAYDSDDVPYRLATFVQITGALVFAAGVKRMFDDSDINVASVGGYVIMRLAMVAQWLRAGAADPDRRVTTRRMATGITLCQLAWIGLYFTPAAFHLPGFVLCAVAELAVPAWAERASPTTWHPHHIAERYGLLTIIVLGESVLAATLAVQAALASGERFVALLPVIAGGLVTVYALWWLYFYRPVHDLLETHDLRKAMIWGYGHYVVFASAAAVGAGLAVAVDQVTHTAHIGRTGAGAAVAIPVALYMLSLWIIHSRPASSAYASLTPVAAVLVLLTPFTPMAVPLIGVILATLLTLKIRWNVGQPGAAHGHAHMEVAN